MTEELDYVPDGANKPIGADAPETGASEGEDADKPITYPEANPLNRYGTPQGGEDIIHPDPSVE